MMPMLQILWFAAKFLILAVAVISIALFVSLLIRQLNPDGLRVRRSTRTRHVETPIAREYTGKDWPAWERNLEFGRYRALVRKLEELGQ